VLAILQAPDGELMSVSDLLAAVPDEPRWVETRSLLLSEDHVLIPAPNGAGFVVCREATAQACVVGRPGRRELERAVRAIGPRGVVLAQRDAAGHVAALLDGWHREVAVLHTLPAGADARWEQPAGAAASFVDPAGDGLLDDVPGDLCQELRAASRWSPIAATMIDRQAVSFSYAAAITERLWDVSIDTIEGFRGRRLAMPALALMTGHMRSLGREPVWGALESNAASLRLAARLGFVPVDTLEVFSRVPQGSEEPPGRAADARE
jgi:hypothetical protein